MNHYIMIEMYPKFVPNGQVGNDSAMVQVMTRQAISQGPFTRYVKLRMRMRRECRERFPRHRG